MGKRQKRIFRNSIKDHVQDLLLRQTVQVVMRNKVVLNGDITKLTEEELHLKDRRFGKHTLAVDEIEEIIYDLEAPY